MDTFKQLYLHLVALLKGAASVCTVAHVSGFLLDLELSTQVIQLGNHCLMKTERVTKKLMTTFF